MLTSSRLRTVAETPSQAESLPENSRWRRHRIGSPSNITTLQGSSILSE